MPTAARWPCAAPSALSSSRLGLISACARGSSARALVMIDDNDVEPGVLGFVERLERLRAAIDANGDASAPRLQFDQRFARRTIALHQPVGDVDHRLGAEPPQKQHQHRRAGRAIDVVIAEDRDRLAASAPRRQAAPPPCPCPGNSRVGEEVADRGIAMARAGPRERRRGRAAARRPARPSPARARRDGASATADRSRICRC